MSHPKHDAIARALGIPIAVVSQLNRRGMPTATVRRARDWYAVNGMRARDMSANRKG